MQPEKKVSFYLHIPFCKTRCTYCDFNTYAGREPLILDYITALVQESQSIHKIFPEIHKICTLYFGGGTPSIIPVEYLEMVLCAIRQSYRIVDEMESTLETNPIPIKQSDLYALRKLGFNRISLGMQSAVHSELKILGRMHTHSETALAVKFARNAGFRNINLDLIYGIPMQTMESFKRSLRAALRLETEHLSLYALSLHKGTPLCNMILADKFPEPDEDLAADMYDYASEVLERAGFQQYEISNWTRGEQFASQHNLQYWHNRNYIGLGAGAHSHYNQRRWANLHTLPAYIQKVNSPIQNLPAAETVQTLSRMDEIQETMIMGLRLTRAGVHFKAFRERFDVSLDDIYQDEITDLRNKELLEIIGEGDDQRLRLTDRARILGNQVFREFIFC